MMSNLDHFLGNYKCNICNKVYKHKISMYRHRRSHKTRCNICHNPYSKWQGKPHKCHLVQVFDFFQIILTLIFEALTSSFVVYSDVSYFLAKHSQNVFGLYF